MKSTGILIAALLAVVLGTPAPAQQKATLNLVTAGDQNMVDYVKDYLAPMFEKEHPGVTVRAVGTGPGDAGSQKIYEKLEAEKDNSSWDIDVAVIHQKATGDLMRRDEDNYFYFVGRTDDMINVGGENVYPKEVEAIIGRHPNVRDVAVVPAPHPTKGAVPIAFVVPHDAGAASEEEIKTFFLERGPAYAHPRRVLFRDSLPLSGTGKLDRTTLQRNAAEDVAG